jgi:hypothetical protein
MCVEISSALYHAKGDMNKAIRTHLPLGTDSIDFINEDDRGSVLASDTEHFTDQLGTCVQSILKIIKGDSSKCGCIFRWGIYE